MRYVLPVLEGIRKFVSGVITLGKRKMTKEKKDAKCDELIDALLEKHGISLEGGALEKTG